jgi:hypothetical protein
MSPLVSMWFQMSYAVVQLLCSLLRIAPLVICCRDDDRRDRRRERDYDDR